MKIAISGASGYIGQHLTSYFSRQKHEVVPLGRELFQSRSFKMLVQRIEGCSVIINLAGAPINKRWTTAYKQELHDSRILVTRQLVNAIKKCTDKPHTFISTSAVGYYPTEGIHDEYSKAKGTDFLAGLCADWETEAAQCPPEVRRVIARLGVVLSVNGGALKQMIQPLELTRTAATIGNGRQPFAWIGLQDLCRAVDFILQHKELEGVVNLTAPQFITQKHLAQALRRAYAAWMILPVPVFFFKMLYGEGASSFSKGQRVRPSKLLNAAFTYNIPTIEKLLNITNYETIDELDVQRYMGKWYEIARFENKFEKGITKATATYTLQSNGHIRVENAGYRNGVLKKAIGRAKQPDKAEPGKLKVAFFLWFYADYYILELDRKNYNYALVGSNSDDYLWILSRTPQLPKETQDQLLQDAARRGYAIDKLIFCQ